jgi:MFS family permease
MPQLPSVPRSLVRRRGFAYLAVFAVAAVGAGLVRTVTTTYLPLLLADIREAPALIGAVMMVNSAAGFAVPLFVGRWSDRRGVAQDGRRPFILGGALLAACGLAAAAAGHGTSFLVLAFAGTIAYVGVNVVTTAHRALVHDCFSGEQYARGNGAQEVAMLTGGLIGLAVGGLLTSPPRPRSSSRRWGCHCSPGRRCDGCRPRFRVRRNTVRLRPSASTVRR